MRGPYLPQRAALRLSSPWEGEDKPSMQLVMR